MVEFRAMHVNCYEVEYKFRSASSGAFSALKVQFTALNKEQAVADSVRFWVGRQRAVPDYFSEILTVQVFTKTIGPIDGEGNMTGSRVSQIFEWKSDWPTTFADYAKEYQEKKNG